MKFDPNNRFLNKRCLFDHKIKYGSYQACEREAGRANSRGTFPFTSLVHIYRLFSLKMCLKSISWLTNSLVQFPGDSPPKTKYTIMQWNLGVISKSIIPRQLVAIKKFHKIPGNCTYKSPYLIKTSILGVRFQKELEFLIKSRISKIFAKIINICIFTLFVSLSVFVLRGLEISVCFEWLWISTELFFIYKLIHIFHKN